MKIDWPEVRELSTGYVHVRFGPECFAQFPKDFAGEALPDEYIFDPEWNRIRVNAWFKKWMERCRVRTQKN